MIGPLHLVLLTLGLACGAGVAGGAPAGTPALRAIVLARDAIARQPASCEPHNQLALALARRARETSDPSYYDQARQEIERSLEIRPGNFTALKLRVWVLLGQHEFARALAEAEPLQRRAPDDVQLNGFLVDALVELGQYERAETAAQWLLDLRPGSIAGLTRVAYLRELFGDLDGAIDLMDAAYQRVPPDEVEDRAWLLTQLAHLMLSSGRLDEAATTVASALQVFPGYHYALALEADVLTARGRFEQAARVRERHVLAAPHPENLHALAVSLERAGEAERADRVFRDFEAAARGEMARADNANRELVLYYADRVRDPERALHVARLEFERRQDLFTRAAYAWALYLSGDVDAARLQIETALAVGIRDARLRYQAGVIALADGDRAAAAGHLEAALRWAPAAEFAAEARRRLESLTPG